MKYLLLFLMLGCAKSDGTSPASPSTQLTTTYQCSFVTSGLTPSSLNGLPITYEYILYPSGKMYVTGSVTTGGITYANNGTYAAGSGYVSSSFGFLNVTTGPSSAYWQFLAVNGPGSAFNVTYLPGAQNQVFPFPTSGCTTTVN
jgi:hypothetical protein